MYWISRVKGTLATPKRLPLLQYIQTFAGITTGKHIVASLNPVCLPENGACCLHIKGLHPTPSIWISSMPSQVSCPFVHRYMLHSHPCRKVHLHGSPHSVEIRGCRVHCGRWYHAHHSLCHPVHPLLYLGSTFIHNLTVTERQNAPWGLQRIS